jgi:hypothetical protein
MEEIDTSTARSSAPSTSTWSVFKADTGKIFNFFFA